MVSAARRCVVFDPLACCGDLRWPVVSQPGQLRKVLAAAGHTGVVRCIYQPRTGNVVEHWEHVGWLCLKAENIIVVCDEVDQVCSASASKNAASPYWKKFPNKTPALEHIVQYGRHSHLAFVGIARAPQDVWRRLTGQSERILVFTMNERLELDALRGRLGSNTDRLPSLGKYEYMDWEDGGSVTICGGDLA